MCFVLSFIVGDEKISTKMPLQSLICWNTTVLAAKKLNIFDSTCWWKWDNHGTGVSALLCNGPSFCWRNQVAFFPLHISGLKASLSLPAQYCKILLRWPLPCLSGYFYWHVLDMYPVTRPDYIQSSAVLYQGTHESSPITQSTQKKSSYLACSQWPLC